MKKAANLATYRQACADLAKAEGARTIVEIGVFWGQLSRLLANVPTLQKLWLVDAWDEPHFVKRHGKQKMNQIADYVISWANTQKKVKVLRMHSIDASILFADESVDFFQTDGDHSLEGITSDLDAWIPKVKIGGIISGDNYESPAVGKTVDMYLPHRQFLANGRFWYARKI